MAIKKALVLYLSLISTLSWANEVDDLPIVSSQTQQIPMHPSNIAFPSPLSTNVEHKKRLLSEHKDEYLKHTKRLKETARITINPHDLTHEQFVALMRCTKGWGIEADCPSPLTNAYKPLQPLFEQQAKPKIPILTMSGGGTRGIIEARICEYIETETGIPIHKLFRLVAATSTGGIIAGGLCFKKPLPKEVNSNAPTDESTDPTSCQAPPYTAKEIVELYRTMAKEIFSKYYYSSLRGLNGTQYSNAPAIKAYQQFYGQARFSQAETTLILTAQNLSESEPYIFSSEKARKTPENEELNQEVWKAMTGATAAPTYLEPIEISGKMMGDGGISNNNPLLIGITEACAQFNVMPHELLILSLGTGLVKADSNKSFKGLGAISWLEEISTNIFNGKAQDFIAKTMLDNSQESDFFGNEGQWLRLQPTLPEELYHLSSYSPKFFDALIKIAEAHIEENKKALDQFIEKVVAAYKLRTAK